MISSEAKIEAGALIGSDCSIWAFTHIRSGASVGAGSTIGENVYIGPGVQIGERCKIQNGVLLYEPAIIEDGVFLGPGTIFTNDRIPRATNRDMSPKSSKDWTKQGVFVDQGASIGAGSVCIAPVRVGKWAMVGAGSVVTRNVPDHALVVGIPAKRINWVDKNGIPLMKIGEYLVSEDGNERYQELSPQSLRVVSDERA